MKWKIIKMLKCDWFISEKYVPIFLTQNTSTLHKLDKVMQIVLKRLCCCYVCIHAKTVELMWIIFHFKKFKCLFEDGPFQKLLWGQPFLIIYVEHICHLLKHKKLFDEGCCYVFENRTFKIRLRYKVFNGKCSIFGCKNICYLNS